MYTILYFSPTGNAKHLAYKLSEHLGKNESQLLALEFTDWRTLKANDQLVILYPIHGFNAPRTIKRFVKNIPKGLYKTVSLIGVGCNTLWLNDAASSDLRKSLIAKNYTIAVDEVLSMPLTFIMAFPDKVSQEVIAESENKIKAISTAIIEKQQSVNDVKFKSRLINFAGKGEGAAARLFGLELHANSKCVSCGICWNNCPEKNISKNSKGKPRFAFKCLMCMRCIYNCPEKAISPRISKFIPISKGYNIHKFTNCDK